MSDDQPKEGKLTPWQSQSMSRRTALVRRGLESASKLLRQDRSLPDVTPFSIGFEDENGLMKIIIPIGTVIPCKVVADIKVLRGPTGDYSLDINCGIQAEATANPVLGVIQFRTEKNQVGSLYARTEFSIDRNGILRLSAFDVITGNPLTLQVIRFEGLSPNELEQQIAASEAGLLNNNLLDIFYRIHAHEIKQAREIEPQLEL